MARKLPEARVVRLTPTPGSARTQRKCGQCMACCQVPAVEEIDKPQGQMCQHAKTGKGCTIHDTKPDACAIFECLWLRGWLEARHKPSRFGIIFDRPHEMSKSPVWEGIPFVVARLVHPAAESTREAKLVISQLATEMVVMIVKANKRKFRGPQDLMHKVLERTRGEPVELQPIPGQEGKFTLKPKTRDVDEQGGQIPPDLEG